jgi:DNA-directed RNA polymerase specialized sigma24 family protein
VQRSTALALLPVVYARILALAGQGLHPSELADRLGVDPSAVGPLLRIARAKFAALSALDEPPERTALGLPPTDQTTDHTNKEQQQWP